jgi:hypothetical protein
VSDEWGPWIEHDGAGCPCEGCYTQDWLADGRVVEGIVEIGHNALLPGEMSAWVWSSLDVWHFPGRVIRYRIRKPRGLTILKSLIEKLPLPEKVDA